MRIFGQRQVVEEPAPLRKTLGRQLAGQPVRSPGSRGPRGGRRGFAAQEASRYLPVPHPAAALRSEEVMEELRCQVRGIGMWLDNNPDVRRKACGYREVMRNAD
jgi:hypothetical protein